MKPISNSYELISSELKRLESLYRLGEFRQFIALFNESGTSEVFDFAMGFERDDKRYSFSEYACLDFYTKTALMRGPKGNYEKFTFEELQNFTLWNLVD